MKTQLDLYKHYCNSLTSYDRYKTIEVKIGDTPLGADHPIRLQSMTTADTMDTDKTVEECIRLADAGSEYIRITAPSMKEAKNLEVIKNELFKKGYNTPLVADIHFTPKAAEIAAQIVEKVRINPGNFVDKKKFQVLEYTEDSYKKELDKIRSKFIPLINICKANGTAMRIGTNHGSLSDRITSQYGDSPSGMVESALEFLRIAEAENYHQIVLSMKSSNPLIMVQAYRLLVRKMAEENLKSYPLHLGVTEAGDGEDGRIKSSMGIGTLLEDGLGDTIRVSLTEDPVLEIPVGRILTDRYKDRKKTQISIPALSFEDYPLDPYAYAKQGTKEVANIGADNVPRVIADFSQRPITEMADLKAIGHFYLPALDKWSMNDLGADYVYIGAHSTPFMLPNGLKAVQDYSVWKTDKDKNVLPLSTTEEYISNTLETPKIVHCTEADILTKPNEGLFEALKQSDNSILLLSTINTHRMATLRSMVLAIKGKGITSPILLSAFYQTDDEEVCQLHASTDLGGVFVDGMGEGIMLGFSNDGTLTLEQIKTSNSLAFGILQASRTRITKTEYISCPSCGRTLFDLQETTAMIRQRTDHLKGVKIAIMGCIVNGPGEMADADYGYVGSGKGKITLYKNKDVVKRAVEAENAVDELINIIKEDGKWTQPDTQNPA